MDLRPQITTKKRLIEEEHHRPLTDAERDELTEAEAAIDAAIVASLPVPRCCQAIQDYPAVAFEVPLDGSEGVWRASLYNPVVRRPYSPKWYLNRPAATHCPFCGSALPKMRRKEEPPVPIQSGENGYYCDTCGERGQCCMCLPPGAAFEIDPATFEMDGTVHVVGGTGCCSPLTMRKCEVCEGSMHYQAVYGGYYHECETCHRTR